MTGSKILIHVRNGSAQESGNVYGEQRWNWDTSGGDLKIGS